MTSEEELGEGKKRKERETKVNQRWEEEEEEKYNLIARMVTLYSLSCGRANMDSDFFFFISRDFCT